MTIKSTSQIETSGRNARLQALKDAVLDWGEKEKKRLEDEVKFIKSILKSRSGAGALAGKNVEDASFYTISKINAFLED
jgi:hypothetical protein